MARWRVFTKFVLNDDDWTRIAVTDADTMDEAFAMERFTIRTDARIMGQTGWVCRVNPDDKPWEYPGDGPNMIAVHESDQGVFEPVD